MQGVVEGLGGQGVALAELCQGLGHCLGDAVEPSGQLGLIAGGDAKLGGLLRPQVAEILGDGFAADRERSRSQLFLLADKAANLAVEAAVVVPPGQPAEHVLQGFDHGGLVLIDNAKCHERGAVGILGVVVFLGCPFPPVHLGRFDGGGHFAGDHRKVFPGQAVDLSEQSVHAALHLGAIEAVVLQVPQQPLDVGGDAVFATGQGSRGLALGKFGAAKMIEVDRAESSGFFQADYEGGDLRAAGALHFQYPCQFGEDEFLPGGDAVGHLSWRYDDQAARSALALLGTIVVGRDVKDGLGPRLEPDAVEFPAVVDRQALARRGGCEESVSGTLVDGAGFIGLWGLFWTFEEQDLVFAWGPRGVWHFVVFPPGDERHVLDGQIVFDQQSQGYGRLRSCVDGCGGPFDGDGWGAIFNGADVPAHIRAALESLTIDHFEPEFGRTVNRESFIGRNDEAQPVAVQFGGNGFLPSQMHRDTSQPFVGRGFDMDGGADQRAESGGLILVEGDRGPGRVLRRYEADRK